MKRHIALLTAGLGLSAATLAIAPAAHATDITNPADNPAPITVKVDGQEYTDGQDTLPGYDDYACTIIPGVSYNYGANTITYRTDSGTKTVHWTEWDRIAGYQVWLKQQSSSSSGSTSTGSSNSSGSGTSSSSSTKSTSTTKSSTSKSSTTKKSATSTAKASATAKPSASASASASADASASTSESASASPSASTSAKPHHHKKSAATEAAIPVEATPSADTTVADDQQLTSASAADHGAGNTHVAGLLVLGAFAVGSVALFAGNAVRTAVGRRRRGDTA